MEKGPPNIDNTYENTTKNTYQELLLFYYYYYYLFNCNWV
jgi:hypothetical protein